MSVGIALSKIDNLLSFIDNIEVPGFSNDTPVSSQQQQQSQQSSNSNNGNGFKPSGGSPASKIMDALNKLNINVSSKTHSAVLTSEEHIAVASDMNGIIVKNIFVKEKRKPTNFLVVYPASKEAVSLKPLGMHLGVGGGLRFVQDPTAVIEMEKGSITPLAVLFDKNKVVQVYVDEDLRNNSKNNSIIVHPGTNSASISINLNDLEKYGNEYGNGINYINLNQFIGEEAKITLQKFKDETKKKHGGGGGGKKQKNKNKNKAVTTSTKTGEKGGGGNKENEGITFDKYTQFGEWYKEIVTKCELIDYTDISGCYVLRPLAYSIWEKIQTFMDHEIKQLGVQNASFPLFVSEAALNTEKEHIEDFSPEVAWVTHSGDTKLENRIAVRPTSETIMYPLFAKWIRSYHDLPLKINQWCNIVRWEFKNPTPFLRTREFLWQEGHTVWETKDEAIKEVYDVLDIYARTYSDICAIPTIKGLKTALETFPGADFSTTVESYIPGSGRGIQGGTSHHLGTHFSCGKSSDGKDNDSKEEGSGGFNITYLDRENKSRHPFQNSWGFTTRSIGVMIMNHSDNKGLVLPPRAAQWQVVIIPIHYKSSEEEHKALENKTSELCKLLNTNNIRTFVDRREGKKPGYKFNEWELKGVPIRLEIGPKDMLSQTVMAARRDERDDKNRLVKKSIGWDNINVSLLSLLDDIQNNLYNKAKTRLEENVQRCTEWQNLLDHMFKGKLVLAPHCNHDECEKMIGELTKTYFENLPDTAGAGQTGKAKALCIPLENTGYQEKLDDSTKCIVPNCKNEKANKWILFGRSY